MATVFDTASKHIVDQSVYCGRFSRTLCSPVLQLCVPCINAIQPFVVHLPVINKSLIRGLLQQSEATGTKANMAIYPDMIVRIKYGPRSITECAYRLPGFHEIDILVHVRKDVEGP